MSEIMAIADSGDPAYRGGLAAPMLSFSDVFDTSLQPGAGLAWDAECPIFGEADEDGEGPESFYDESDAPDLYNAIEALHAHKPIAFLLPRRDKAPMVVATSKKSRKTPGYTDLPMVPAGPAGILTYIDTAAEESGAEPDRDAGGVDPTKRRRTAAAAATVAPSLASRASTVAGRKRTRTPGLPSDAASLLNDVAGGDELGGAGGGAVTETSAAVRAAMNVHAASMPVVSSLMHLRHVPIEDACKAVGTATSSVGGGLGQLAQAGYCSYADLYAKLLRIETNSVK